MNIIEGSFRDPQGHVYTSEDRIFRVINKSGESKFNILNNSLILEKSINSGYLVKTWIPRKDQLPFGYQDKLIYEHQKIPYISYPYEWSFSQLKEAALHHLNYQIFLLGNNFHLNDSSSFNIQFIGAKSIFIDSFSITPYKEGDFWYGQKQFLEQFLNPLLFSSYKNIPFNNFYRGNLDGIKSSEILKILNFFQKFIPKIFLYLYLPYLLERGRTKTLNFDNYFLKKNKFKKNNYLWILNNLKNIVENIRLPNFDSYWENYEITSSYDKINLDIKSSIVKKFIKDNKINIIADLGCNTGHYSELCLNNGCQYVVGFDSDAASIEKSYIRSKNKKLNFLPLILDATNPPVNLGWFEKERQGFLKRSKFDALLALAFEHHIIIGKNVPIESFIKWLTSISSKGLVEFIPKTDNMIKIMLNLKGDIFPDYNEDNFINIMKKYVKIIKIQEIGSTGRKVIEFDGS
jgi:ribosomal protein L11 methylase PrmA